MMPDYSALVPEEWKLKTGWHGMPAEQRRAIGEFGAYMFGLGRPTVGDIEEVKYDGRLVILDDGSRWEVDSAYADTVDAWGSLVKVVVIDDVMYNLDDADRVDVAEEL